MNMQPYFSNSSCHCVTMAHHRSTSRQELAHDQQPGRTGCLLKVASGSTWEEPRRSHIKAAGEWAPH